MTRMSAAGAAMLAILMCMPAASASVAEPAGYRMDDYKAPVPATLAGAKVVSTEEAAALWRDGKALFVDVLPKPVKPDLPEGTLWREPPRRDIPGSVWLPDVGYGALAPEMEAWFADKLAEATAGDKLRPVVLYCLAECWMSWNAAKRAVGWGYSVIWYPDGTDGWEAADLPLEERKAELRPWER